MVATGLSPVSFKSPSKSPAKSIGAGKLVHKSGLIASGIGGVCFGDILVALLGKGDTIHPAFCTSPMAVRALTELEFCEVIGSYGPELTQASFNVLARNTARCLTMSCIARTADFLIEQAEKQQPDKTVHVVIDLPLRQTVLAQLLGMTPVHMNRTMNELKTRRLIRVASGKFTILDISELARLTACLSRKYDGAPLLAQSGCVVCD